MKHLITNINFLSAVAFGVLWIWGFYSLFNSRYLLGPVHAWLESKLNYKIMKPVMSCPPCMSSLHGTGLYIFLFPGFNVAQWIIFVIILMGANYLIKEFLYPAALEEEVNVTPLDPTIMKEAEGFISYTDIDPTNRQHQNLVKELLDHIKKSQ